MKKYAITECWAGGLWFYTKHIPENALQLAPFVGFLENVIVFPVR